MSSSGDGWIKPEKTCVEGKKTAWIWMDKNREKNHVLREKNLKGACV
jgi:hypothetical protein